MSKKWNKNDKDLIHILLIALDNQKKDEKSFIKELLKSENPEFNVIAPCFNQNFDVGIDDEIECIKLTLKVSKGKAPYYKMFEEYDNKD